MLNVRSLVTVNGHKFMATRAQADTLAVLTDARKGGFARVFGYVATSGRTIPTIYDATVTTRFSYTKLLERKRKVLESLTLDAIKPFIASPKLKELSDEKLSEVFTIRKNKELASIETTTSGDRSDAHRQGHDRCYANIADGVVVHYVTEKGADGLMHPVIVDGFPVADSIMLNVLEVSRTVHQKGEYKVVNSGPDVLMSKAIEAAAKASGLRSIARLSLKEDSFDRLAIAGDVIMPEDCEALMV